ncbi:MAG: hypothetical protein HW413_1767 [Thermoleophilia bacterium]|nr:hypothetical protein [Thermoleophilia bacterium]
MTSPDLIHELQASRPEAPTTLRTRVRGMAAQEQKPPVRWPSFRLPVRRMALVAVPAAAALALVSAGAIGLSRSNGEVAALRGELDKRQPEVFEAATPDGSEAYTGTLERTLLPQVYSDTPQSSAAGGTPTLASGVGANQQSAIGPTDDRKQRVSATLTVEVADSDAVSRAAQDALDLTRRLGGHVVSASVATGEEGSAALTVRVPVGKVQEAIVGLSALGRIVSQQVTIQDLQETLDALERRARSVRAQIALISARLDSESLEAETRAVLENRLKTLRGELRELRRGISGTNAEARMSTIQLTVVTPGAFGAVAPPARLDRTIDEALNVLLWEGVIVLALLIVMAPFALVAFAAWFGRRFHRRREEERLLALP